MKRMLMLVGVAGLFATFASVAAAGPGKGQTRQLTGKVTSVTTHSITVKAPRSSLTCAARAGLQLGTFMGKRATMTCRMAAGRLVVSRVKVASNGAAMRKDGPSSQAPSSSSSQGRSGPSSSSDDPGDDDSGTADDDSGDDDSGTADDDSGDDDDSGTADDDSGDDGGDDEGDDD